jgi:hypothetical protein
VGLHGASIGYYLLADLDIRSSHGVTAFSSGVFSVRPHRRAVRIIMICDYSTVVTDIALRNEVGLDRLRVELVEAGSSWQKWGTHVRNFH